MLSLPSLCCFGPGAALYDSMLVTMAPGTTAEFITYPVAVEGVFSVHDLGPVNRNIYHLDGAKVK